MNEGPHISQEDLALHAMQAMPREGMESVREHLSDCEWCREELAALNGDLALVAVTVARRPVPQGAKQRFMQKLAVAGPAGGAARHAAEVVPIDRRQMRRRGSWVPWAAVALLALAIGLGVRVKQLSDRLLVATDRAAKLTEDNRQLAAQNAHAREVLEVLTAPHAQRAVLSTPMVRQVPWGRAVYLSESGALVFVGCNLARLPEGKTYELWLIPANGHAPMPAGMFRPDAMGDASVMMPPLPKGVPAKAFGVTIEKAGGSDTPTMPLVLSGAAMSTGA
jgi:Anti-sigma-K factor rskA